MAERVLLAPSILAADLTRLGEQVRAVEQAGADLLHIDVMDGSFVPNISFGPLVVEALRPITSLPLHVHLMIVEPERHIDAFCRAGADLITVHVETCPHLDGTLQQIRDAGAQASVTLNPATPLSTLEHVLPLVDLVLIMTVNPGFGGQTLLPYTLEKVTAACEMLARCGNSQCMVEVDGGISPETAPAAVAAGADVLVMGSAIFRHPQGIARAMSLAREAAKEASR